MLKNRERELLVQIEEERRRVEELMAMRVNAMTERRIKKDQTDEHMMTMKGDAEIEDDDVEVDDEWNLAEEALNRADAMMLMVCRVASTRLRMHLTHADRLVSVATGSFSFSQSLFRFLFLFLCPSFAFLFY